VAGGFAFTGTGEVGATVSLNLNSGTLLAGGNTALVGSNGSCSAPVSASDVTAFGIGSEIISASQTDTAGNTSNTPATRNLTVNALALTLVTIDDKTGILGTSSGDITFTFTFSQAVTGFAIGDIDVVHGSKGAFTGSGTTYTLVVTPTPGFEGNVAVDVGSGVASNPNSAAIQNVQVVDTLAPTLAITSNVSALKVGEAATITFSADPSSSFAWDGSNGDVVVSGGTLGAISGSGLTRTAAITPSAGLASGNASITVASGAYADAAGNSGGAGTTPTITIDTLAPAAPTIAAVTGNDIVNSVEATAGFAITGTGEVGATMTLNLGSGTTLAGGNTAVVASDGSWTLAVLASDGTALGLGSETIHASQSDIAGNISAVPGTRTFSVNALALTLVITDDKNTVVNASAGDITYTFTFSDGVTGSSAGDIDVVNGSKGVFSGSGTTLRYWSHRQRALKAMSGSM
jgi:hypothetical protein